MTEKALVKNAADEEQVKESTRKVRYKRTDERADIEFVMGSVHGRRFMWRVLAHCGAYRSVFAVDPHVTAFNSGKQDVGHFLMAELNDVCPKEFSVMTKEATEGLKNV